MDRLTRRSGRAVTGTIRRVDLGRATLDQPAAPCRVAPPATV